MKKITKSLTAIQIGTALSPLLALTQAQADQLDDVQMKADNAGVRGPFDACGTRRSLGWYMVRYLKR